MNLRFMNDWGNQYGLWGDEGAFEIRDASLISEALQKRLREQSDLFHTHYSADSGLWSSGSIREQHLKLILELALQLRQELPETVNLEHDPWEHHLKAYAVQAVN